MMFKNISKRETIILSGYNHLFVINNLTAFNSSNSSLNLLDIGTDQAHAKSKTILIGENTI